MAAGMMLLSALSFSSGDKRTVAADVSGSRVNLTGIEPGEQHAGYIKLLSGDVKIEENQVKGGSFTLDMNSITGTGSSETKLASQLKSAEYFDAKNYPTAAFVITGISKLPVEKDGEIKATHRIEGNMTVKGVTRKISFDASVNVLKGKVALSSQPFTMNDLKMQIELICK